MLKMTVAAGALVLAGALAFADDKPAVPEDAGPAIDEAKAAFAAGEINHARRALETAAASVAVKEANAVRAVLPKPLDGWTMNDSDTTNLGMIALNGGLSLDRTYTSSDGAVTVKIEAVIDSDIVAQMWAALSDPTVVAASGMKTETFNGETGLIDQDGHIVILVDKRTTFTISGSAPPEVVKGYAQKIDFPVFKAMK